MYRGNLQRTGYYPTDNGSFKGELVWKHIVAGGEITSPATTYDGTVFFGSTGPSEKKQRLWALDVLSGKAKWSKPLEEQMNLVACISAGYVVVGDGNILRVFDADKGNEQWRVKAKWFLESLAICDKVIYVGERGLSSDENFLSAFDLETGAKKWQKAFPNPPVFYPAIAEGTIIAMTQRNQFLGMLAAICSPNFFDSTLVAIDCLNGSVKWQASKIPGPAINSPILHENMVFVPYRKGISAHDIETGEGLWRWEFDGNSLCGPAAIRENLFLCATSEGINAKNICTGKSIWKFCVEDHSKEDEDETIYLETTTAVSIIGDTAVIGLSDGFLYGVDVTNGKELWKCEMDELEQADIDDRRFNHSWVPVYGDGTIFVGGGNTLYAIR